jgi:hypothetical protein
MSATKSVLTELYDCPQVYKRDTIGSSEIEINNPVISIMTASTIEWFLERLTESDIMGGFLTRFLLIMGQRKTSPIPIPPPVDLNKKALLIEELKVLSKITGIASLMPEAKKLHDQWYIKHSHSVNGFRYGAFFHRMQIYLLKIAMLMEVAETGTIKVTPQSMQEAINFINWVSKNLRSIENDELVFNKYQRHIKVVKQYLKGKGKVSRSDLIRGTHLTSKETSDAVRTLLDSEVIRAIEEFNPDSKRRVTFYESSQQFTKFTSNCEF